MKQFVPERKTKSAAPDSRQNGGQVSLLPSEAGYRSLRTTKAVGLGGSAAGHTKADNLTGNPTMNSTQETAATGMGIVATLFLLVIILAVYVFFCFCYKRICEKTGRNPGVLIWIPILQLIPLLQAAGMAVWMIILLLIPLVNIVVFVIMWAKICTALGKSPWLVILVFIPVVNIFFVPYLAFSNSAGPAPAPA